MEEESNPVAVRAQFETPLPQSLPQSSAVTGSRPTLALVDAAPNSHKSGPMPSKRPISWGSARNRRARTGREAVEVVGGSVLSLGTLPAGTTEAQVDDMMMVLEVADEAPPPPTRSRPEPHPNSNPSYIISAFFSLSLYTPCDESSPSTERCERRASRASDS